MFSRLGFFLRHSMNDLRVNSRRTIFALLCIAAGVATVVSLQAMGIMIRNALTMDLAAANGGDIQISLYKARQISTSQVRPGLEQGILETDGNGYFLQAYGVQKIQDWFGHNNPGAIMTYRWTFPEHGPFSAALMKDLRTGQEQSDVVPFIVDTQAYPLYGVRKTEDGRSLKAVLKTDTDVVLSRNLADALAAEVGDEIDLNIASRPLTVRGIVPADAEAGLDKIDSSVFGYYYMDVRSRGLFQNPPPMVNVVFIRLPG
jgi:predicted lysophospholipase L1 biosynthesis ABC-type transport system permease subunit